MKLGFFTMPMHPPGRDYTQTLKEDREAVLLADRLGYCDAFIGEHVTDVCETIPSCLSFIASLAHETRHIRLGSGTVNLPNSHPALVAAHVAMVDHMLEGRFIFGIGPGGLRSDMEAFGNLDADRNAMFVESIDQILELWANDAPYDLKGRYWNISTTRTLIRDFANAAEVILVGSARLAGYAEAELNGKPVDDAAIATEIAPCFIDRDGRRTDTIVLACTHYPLLLDRMRQLSPWPVSFHDPAPAIARRVVELLGAPHGAAASKARFVYASGAQPSTPLRAALARFGFGT